MKINNLVIEFQNSPMSFQEMQSRENFYQKMIWVVNGQAFKQNFHIFDKLPDPEADFVQEIYFCEEKYNPKNLIKMEDRGFYKSKGIAFYRKADCFNGMRLLEPSKFKDVEDKIENYYLGHHLFDWIRPKEVWYQATMPVYFDFDESDRLWNLQRYDDKGMLCIQVVSKSDFIKKTLGEM